MDKFMTLVIGVALLVLFSFLFAYPVMWLINVIFTPSFLVFVFGTTKISVWTAWALGMLVSMLFSRRSSK